MPNLQIKGINEDLYEGIKRVAAQENRSVSQQVLYLIRQCLLHHRSTASPQTPAETLLSLAGSWSDDREAAAIVADLRASRKKRAQQVEL